MSQEEGRSDTIQPEPPAGTAPTRPRPRNAAGWGEKLVVPILAALIGLGGVALGSNMANQQAEKTASQQIEAQANEARASFSRTYRQAAYSAFISDNASLLTAQERRAAGFRIPEETKRSAEITQAQIDVDQYASKVLADTELVRVIGSQETISWANQVLDEQDAYNKQYEDDSIGNGPTRNPAADVATRIDGHTYEVAGTKGPRQGGRLGSFAAEASKDLESGR